VNPKTLRLVLGDQLNRNHTWWKEEPGTFTALFVESRGETDYAVHHIQKVVAFFIAMRAFADELIAADHSVLYIALDDKSNKGSIAENVNHLVEKHSYQRFEYQSPDEWRLDKELQALAKTLKVETQECDTEHFITKRAELADFFKGKKTYVMESFYRMLRKREHVLMDFDQPAGVQWNYDKSNRKTLPDDQKWPEPLVFDHDAAAILEMIDKAGVKTMGRMQGEHSLWPANRQDSEALLAFFIQHCLPNFGNYQDAMASDAWSLYHARLSFSMNTKMLNPREIIEAVESAWREDPDRYPLAAAEGFIRQILGWREYMRGVYWAQMPEYANKNFFDHTAALPAWYWTGDTKMNCMKQAIGQSLDYAYAHHIQRLMITGSFALLLGVNPDEVDAWYLGVYIDAIEWVEITNTRGMSQYADGGLVATKPYCSTANYIDKMSDYCGNCYYDKKLKVGEKACPFNALYWDFYDRNRRKLENNPRIGFVYPTLDKMKPAQRQEIMEWAEEIKNRINDL